MIGYDISEWQNVVDFSALKAEFLIIRSSYGTGYIDKQFQRNVTEARKKGIPIGFYHYAYPTYNTPEAEADWFLHVVGKPQEGECLVLDFEEKYTDPVGWSKKFLDRLSVVLKGYKPLIYLNRYLTQTYNWSSVVKAGYGLWLAYWDYDKTADAPSTPWPVVALRQYSNKEVVKGIVGGVDANVFYGDVKQFKKYGLHYTTEPETPVEDIVEAYKAQIKALEDKIKILEDTLATNITPLNTKRNEVYVYGNVELLKELLNRIRG